VRNYAAAAESANWPEAATAAERLLAYPPDTLPMSRDERVQMVSIAADAAAQAGQTVRALELYRRLIAEIEARDGAKSYALVAPLGKLAELLAAQGQFDDAAQVLDRSVTLREDELGPDNTALLPFYETRRAIERKRLAAASGNPAKVSALQQRLDDQDYAIETLESVAKARAAAAQNTTVVTRGVNDSPFQLVSIHYGTNREPTGKAEPAQFYGDKRGPLALGIATVSVPKTRAVGEIPLPSMWHGDFRPDAAKHFILTKMEPIATKDAFAASARAQMEKSKLREALVFIHGYNSDFQSSVFRAAQLAVDLDIDGAAFMYSWPSKGSLPGYVADGAQVIRPLTRSLQELLDIVVQKTGAERVHVVAHSMGNRYLLEALDLIAREIPADQHKPIFQQVVFAAPDVDADDFTDRVKQIGWLAQRMTLYASSKDRALYLSSVINGGYRRAGDAGALVTITGLDTVDTTEVGGEGLGHGDFADRALDDFRAIVWLSLQPQSRCVLVDRRQPTGGDYWQLTVDQIKTCPAEAFRTAISLLRALGATEALAYVRGKIESARAAKDAAAEARYVALLPIFDSLK
jgi:esterase/lipase superfamily enzyme